MGKITTIIFTFIFFFISTTAVTYAEERVEQLVKIKIDSRTQIDKFVALRLTLVEATDTYVKALVTADEIKMLEKYGYTLEVIIEDIRHELDFLDTEPNDGEYHDYNELKLEMEQIASDHSNIARLYVYGKSVAGRDILAMKVTDNPEVEEHEPEVLLTGAHHGNERISVEVPLYMINFLTDNYGILSKVTYLVDNREIWVVPMVNPDGVERRSRYNSNGVDLNRDYGYMWEGWGGSPSPFSQPEVQAIRNLTVEHVPVIHMTYHSGTKYISYPWSYHPDATCDRDAIDYLCQIYSDYTGYKADQGYHGMYPIHGSSKDYDYGCLGTFGWTVELSYSFTPPASEIDRICELNRDPILHMIYEAGKGLTGVITDIDTGEPLLAMIEVLEIGWPVYTDPFAGDYHRYLLPGSYTVRIFANGYISQIIPDIVIVADDVTTLDVALKRAAGAYAYSVVSCNIADPNDRHRNHSLTPWALGEPDGQALSIGVQGDIVLDTGERTPIVNQPGTDFKVYEAGPTTDEKYYVYLSNGWRGPWRYLGMGTGSQEFDIVGTELSKARYIKIVDDGDGDPNASDAGYDLDGIKIFGVALVGINLYPEDDVISAGDVFQYTARLVNNTDSIQTVHYWAEVFLPSGAPYRRNPVYGPDTISLSGNETKEIVISHLVPSQAPTGVYSYVGKVGVYPDSLWELDRCNVRVTKVLAYLNNAPTIKRNTASTRVDYRIFSLYETNVIPDYSTTRWLVPQDVELRVYNLIGQLIANNRLRNVEPNYINNYLEHSEVLTAGVYFYRTRIGNSDMFTRKIVITR